MSQHMRKPPELLYEELFVHSCGNTIGNEEIHYNYKIDCILSQETENVERQVVLHNVKFDFFGRQENIIAIKFSHRYNKVHGYVRKRESNAKIKNKTVS